MSSVCGGEGPRTPQVGMAEATESQAVWAVTEDAKSRAMVARIVEVFMMAGGCSIEVRVMEVLMVQWHP